MIITTVADGFQEDYGKSIGRIPKNYFKNLNLEIGEIVEVISGNRRVGVFLRPIEEITNESIPQRMLYSKPKKSSIKEEDIILHLNGFLRASIRVGLGQKVRIDKTSAPNAEKALIAALNHEDREKIFIDYITNRPIYVAKLLNFKTLDMISKWVFCLLVLQESLG